MSRSRAKPPSVYGVMLVDEAAEYLGIAPRKLMSLRKAGTGPACGRIVGRVVYHRDDLDEWRREAGQ